MATNYFLNFTITLFLSLSLLPPSTIHSQMSSSNDNINRENDDQEELYYVVDNPIRNFRTKSCFLGNIIKEGTHCDPNHVNNLCNGVSADKAKSLLFCCKTRCRNVLGDNNNNCGGCGRTCRLGERCCDGNCTVVSSSAHHCGECGGQCKAGVKCNNGYCGYA